MILLSSLIALCAFALWLDRQSVKARLRAAWIFRVFEYEARVEELKR